MKKFGIVFAGKALRVLSSLVVITLLSRSVDQEQFGKFSYAVSIYSVFIPFVVFGLENYVIRYYKGSKGINLTHLLVANGILSVFAILVFYFFSLNESHLIGFILLSVILAFSPVNYLLNAAQEHLLIAKVSLLVSSVSMLLKVAIILLSDDVVQHLLLAFGLDFFLPVVLVAFVSKAKFRISKIKLNSSYQLLSYSFPFFLSAAIVVLLNKTDQLMIPHLLDYEELAKYSLSYRLYEGLFVLHVVFNSLFFPLLAKKGLNKCIEIVGAFAVIWVFVIFLISLILGISGPGLFSFLFGSEYRLSSFILILLSISLLPAFWGNVISKVAALTEGGGKALAYNNFFTLVANVILNLVLIPLWGVFGAVFATILSQLLGSVMVWFFYDQFKKTIISILHVSYSSCIGAIRRPLQVLTHIKAAMNQLIPTDKMA